jgi:PPM family protein phosphatase
MKLSDTVVIHSDEPAPAPTSRIPCTVRSFGLSDPGRMRPSNEDQFVVVELARTMTVHWTSIPQAKAQYSSHRGYFFVVADGMGGHQAGEVASALSVLTVEGFLLNSLNRFFNLKSSDEQNVMMEFQTALLQADARVVEEASQHPELMGMGTTLTMAFVVNWKLFVAHVGDSRCSLFSKNELHQLTNDHTMVAEMVRKGALSPTEASRHPHRHVITNFLGGADQTARVELHKLDLEPEDVILLCSDGLTEMVSDDDIATVLRNERDPQRICERLVTEANEKGGKDNITAVVGIFRTP